MLSKFVLPGERLEMQLVHKGGTAGKEDGPAKVYISRVHEILSESTLEVSMPMEKTKLVLLPLNDEVDTCFYTKLGLYQCYMRIVDRYKKDKVYLLKLEMTTNLRKFQRREFYRFSCTIEMQARALEETEKDSLEKHQSVVLDDDVKSLKKAVVIDLSGGGLRFIASEAYQIDELVHCRYQLFVGGRSKEYDLVGKVLKVRELERRPGEFEHGVQFINVTPAIQDEIVKYIFEEELKNRRRGH